MFRTPLVRYLAATVFVFAVLPAVSSRGQLPVPQLQSVFPAGARQGTTVECTITGSDVNAATGLYFSNPGITATPIKPNVFKVQVAAGVPIGRYDVRAVCPAGVSSYRSFVVGDRPEFIEKEPNNTPQQAERVSLPVVINGQTSGGIDLDYFVFTAKKGQRIFINCWAWRLDSFLDGTLLLQSSDGKELAYGGDYYGKDPFIDFTVPSDGDYTVKLWDFIYGGGAINVYRLEIGSLPHLDAVLPAAIRPGESSKVTLLGRNLPGGVPVPGMTVQGRPLETLSRDISAPSDPAALASLHAGEAIRPPQTAVDGMEYRLTTPQGASNPLFIGFATDPIVLEHEPNDSRESAQRLSIPCEVSGTFTPTGDKDVFAFSATKGEKIVVEVFGERHSGLVDPILSGYDSRGNRLSTGTGDDDGRNIGQLRFTTTTRDGRWDFTAPADGEYFVQVRDLYSQQRGEPRFTYRLSVRSPRPDFRLLAVPVAEVQPDATVVRRGGNHWLDVLAFRKDGFDDPIVIEASHLPPGVSCEKVTIGPGKTSVPLVFHTAADASLGHAEIQITGRATIDGKEVTRAARAGGLVWATVNTPGIARMADAIVVAVRERAPFGLSAKAAKTSIAPGETLPIDVTVERAPDWSDGLQLSGFDLPNNATVALVSVGRGAKSGQVQLKLPTNAKPGPYTFTIQASGQVPRNYATETDPAKRGNNIRVVATSNPITIQVTAPAAK